MEKHVFIKPLKEGTFKLGDKFGPRMHPIKKRKILHKGVDFAAKSGIPIIASTDGVIVHAKDDNDGYGNDLILKYNEKISTRYCHCSKYAVKAGDKVKQGQVIAYVGSTGFSTGPHLHWEVLQNGVPINPEVYIKL